MLLLSHLRSPDEPHMCSFFHQGTAPPLSSPVCSASFWIVSWCSGHVWLDCVSMFAAPPTGVPIPLQMNHSRNDCTAYDIDCSLFWILSRDQWVSGVGHGDFRNLLSLVQQRNPVQARPLASKETSTMSLCDFPVLKCKELYTFLGCSRPFYSAPVWEKS